MQLAGIDCHFTGHSTRSASTSAAARAGVPLDSILVAADWSSSAGDFQALLPEICRQRGVCKGSTHCVTGVTGPWNTFR